MLRRVLAAAVLLLALSLCGTAVALERITDFRSDVRIAPDGVLTVRETISVWVENVSIRHGLLRDFPTTYVDRRGARFTTGFHVVSVLLDGKPETFEVQSIAAGKRVKIGRGDTFVPPGLHRYTIAYTTDRQIRFFPGFDELYWNATGNEWTFPIEHAVATIDLPPGARIEQSAAYTGEIGSTASKARITRLSDTQIRFETTAPLGVNEGLTVAVGFTKGAVAPPTGPEAAMNFVRDNAAAATALAGVLLLLLYYGVAWVFVGRDPSRGVIIPLFGPPADLSPASVRFVYQMDYDDKIFAAAVVNMAVKRFLSISEDDGTYTLVRTSTPAAEAKLSRDEQRIAETLQLNAPGRAIVLTRTNRSTIAASIKALKRWLTDTAARAYFRTNRAWALGGLPVIALTAMLVAVFGASELGGPALVVLGIWTYITLLLLGAAWKNWRDFRRHATWRFGSLVSAVALLIAVLVVQGVGALFAEMVVDGIGAPAALALAASCAIAYVFHHLLKAPTLAGAKIRDQIDGFRIFLETAERDRLEALHPPEITPAVFERFLPYAMALDCENEWAERFQAEAAAAGQMPSTGSHDYDPDWYSGSSRGWSGVSSFASSLGPSLASATASAAATQSSSSGSSGGGSSGGGGGGGGGSGW